MTDEATGRTVLELVLDLVGGSLVTVVYGSMALALLLWLLASLGGAGAGWGVAALLTAHEGMEGVQGDGLQWAAAVLGGLVGLLMALAAAGTQSVGMMGAVGSQVSGETIGSMGRLGAALHVLLGLLGLSGTVAAVVAGFAISGG